MKRRSFLKKSSLVSLPAFLGGFELATLSSSNLFNIVNGDDDKVLVLIDLNGGNDGLSSFVPLDYFDNLANARPNLFLPENQLLTMTDTIGLHPEMVGINNLYDNGNLALVQGVAYPDQNRSHFRSADIWNTGVKADEFKSTGWMGRYFDDEFPGYPSDYPNNDCPDPFAITLGKSLSGTCQGINSNFSLAILDVEYLGGLTTGIEAPLPDDCYGAELGYIVDTFKKSNAYAERIIDAVDSGNSIIDYPNNSIAERLKVIAQMISGGLQTKVFVIRQGGYDTHADQVVEGNTTIGQHAELLSDLSSAIYAFQEDLKALDIDQRVIGMTFSEFGRKIISNAALGTDHGTAAPMMIFGSCINPGVIGSNPEISNNVDIEEGVAMQYDFKSVYGSIMMDWFGVPEADVRNYLFEDFQHIPIINSCLTTNTNNSEPIPNITINSFPNPFDNQVTVELTTDRPETVRIDLTDVVGKRVKTLTNRSLARGNHQISISGHDLNSGVYFVRVEMGKAVKTLRVVKR